MSARVRGARGQTCHRAAGKRVNQIGTRYEEKGLARARIQGRNLVNGRKIQSRDGRRNF